MMKTGHLESMTELLRKLVSCPSRAQEDSPEPVLLVISKWLQARSIPHDYLRNEAGLPLGLWGKIQCGRPGPAYLLDATADTAPFGDKNAWRHPPRQAIIKDGWLYGRGSADSKAGIAVFCHVLASLLPESGRLAGSLEFVFEAEEHTGSFSGIRKYMEARAGKPLDGVMIGYPGNDRLVIGQRGFLRACLSIHGVQSHSGSSGNRGVNAIERTRALLADFVSFPLPAEDGSFPLPPKMTPTGIRSGGSFTVVPDLCELDLDIRLTPAFDEAKARIFLDAAVKRLDADGTTPSTNIKFFPSWPAYQLDPSNPMVQALAQSARQAFGHEVLLAVVGPSSIANYLATLDIPATAGLGVSYRNIHASNECVFLETLEPTYVTYREALIRLLQ